MKRTDLTWILFVLRRFNAADTKGRSAITGILSVLGIAFGVTVLIVILAVMNGFQRSFIDTILQVSSAHVQLYGSEAALEQSRAAGGFKAFYVFSETQTIMQGNYGRQQPAILRAVPKTILSDDRDLAGAITMMEGAFDLSAPHSIVLGYELARLLSVSAGDSISLLALSGTADTDIFPEDAECMVAGLMKTGYYAIDAGFAFMSTETGEMLCGTQQELSAAVKLQNSEADGIYIARIAAAVPELKAESWRTYNQAFFGALRIEKNTMFMLVFLIFVVVTVNIYNGMRRSIYERREEISVLASLGAKKEHIQALFIANGFTIGLLGASIGLLLGLLLSADINRVFLMAEYLINAVIEAANILLEYTFFTGFSIFSPQYFYIDSVPVRIFFGEVFLVFLFGVFSASFAASIAARKILTLKPAEVLRYE
ncbi:ABC transporter permease [Treponema medium]|uniref:ABC transporter permease n=1 Tax=Treponema medium TaxID=58231 RepID=UPI00198000D9|nr:FtsX-like permease family protein [Treponema medium]QSH92814.1 ABC transporter permease [Treponema medium]